ncbi:hypothetical protein [Desulfobacter hydrogenophilus]|uniref:Uncharacterized protein n=1 Tax=Desulfobacter hydrogenophilus TaxID=2291 RepID=A0ABX5RES4_9BACT|nr:hypothetical protein [Desulfobacter hydrogenophilus]NDY72269.1 hypothetical protein [Desulfobacter hydrogenophilus]QBH12897.1 hypothetical protein EYB58_08200 [Desulfobacter hydrogenophilus]
MAVLYERTTNDLNSFMVCCRHADERSRRPIAVIKKTVNAKKIKLDIAVEIKISDATTIVFSGSRPS